MDKAAERSIADEKVWVNRPDRVRRMFVVDVAVGVVSIAAMAAIGNAGGWVDTVARLFLGVYVGTRILARVRRAMAYRNGWLDGRTAMVLALGEAAKRGLDLDEWLTSEYERDAIVMGVSPDLFGDD